MDKINFNFNLKDSKVENSLVLLIATYKGDRIRVSTGKTVYVKAWDKEKQRCFTSSEKFTSTINRNSKEVNKFLDKLIDLTLDHYRINNPNKITHPFQTVKP